MTLPGSCLQYRLLYFILTKSVNNYFPSFRLIILAVLAAQTVLAIRIVLAVPTVPVAPIVLVVPTIPIAPAVPTVLVAPIALVVPTIPIAPAVPMVLVAPIALVVPTVPVPVAPIVLVAQILLAKFHPHSLSLVLPTKEKLSILLLCNPPEFLTVYHRY